MSHTTRRRWSAAVLTAVAGLALAGCGTAEPTATSRISTAFELPGERVYPEGIAADERTGDLYVGSYADGTVYRVTSTADRAEPFLAAGTDGRRTANGLRVDPAGRLWVIDSTAGVDIYDIGSRQLCWHDSRCPATVTGSSTISRWVPTARPTSPTAPETSSIG